MQSLLGVDLFGAHGADMKQISDKKEHQTQARMDIESLSSTSSFVCVEINR